MSIKIKNKRIEQWSLFNAILLILAFITSIYFKNLNYLCYVFSTSILILIVISFNDLIKMRLPFGIANCITLLRFLLVLISFLYIDFNKQLPLFTLFLVFAVVLDFFDGIAARQFYETSVFGQYFDMEVDAFFVLTMCCYYYIFADIGFWILIPGILRYVYRLYTFLVPKKNFKETKQKYATIIAGTFFVILLLCLLLDGWLQESLLILGALSITLSFAWGFKQYHST